VAATLDVIRRLSAAAPTMLGNREPRETAARSADALPPDASVGAVSTSPSVLPRVTRILRGESSTFEQVVADLAADDPGSVEHWRRQLERFFEAILERALAAGALDPPAAHPFWGSFTSEQRREILTGLGSLGYRFDGLGGWLDDRVPTKRDLSVAVGYAGLEPVRVRHWPTPDEMTGLLSQVQIAGDEYLNRVAPGLTAGELAPELKSHAEAMEALLADWERVRRLLLAET
jgi:hypothetical protein